MTASLGPDRPTSDERWYPVSPADELRLFRDLFAGATVSVLLVAIALYWPAILPRVVMVLMSAWAVYVLLCAAVDAHVRGMRRVRR